MTNNPQETQNLDCPPTKPRLAIAKLVHSIIGDSRQKRRNLLSQLGYANKSKAAQRFDAMLCTGHPNPRLMAFLPQALGVAPEVVQSAIEESRLQNTDYAEALAAYNEAVEQARFKPHIFVEVDLKKRKCPLVVCGMFGQGAMRVIEVPADLPLEIEADQIATVERIITQYEESQKHRQCVAIFSGPVSFTYYRTFDEGWEFSSAGVFVGKRKKRKQEPLIEVSAGRKVLVGPGRSVFKY